MHKVYAVYQDMKKLTKLLKFQMKYGRIIVVAINGHISERTNGTEKDRQDKLSEP